MQIAWAFLVAAPLWESQPALPGGHSHGPLTVTPWGCRAMGALPFMARGIGACLGNGEDLGVFFAPGCGARSPGSGAVWRSNG